MLTAPFNFFLAGFLKEMMTGDLFQSHWYVNYACCNHTGTQDFAMPDLVLKKICPTTAAYLTYTIDLYIISEPN